MYILVVNATVDSHYFVLLLFYCGLFFIFSYKRNSRNCNFILLYIYQYIYTYIFRNTFIFLFAASNYLLRAEKCNQCVKLDNLKCNKVF